MLVEHYSKETPKPFVVSQDDDLPLKCTHTSGASGIGSKHEELRHRCDLGITET